MTTFKLKTEREVSIKDVADLLVGAFEGGSGYWAQIIDYKKPSGKLFNWPDDKEAAPRYISYPLTDGGAVIIKDLEDEDSKALTLDLAAIKKGLELMAEKHPRHFNDFVDENHDASTSDVFLQLATLGEIVYG